MFRGIAAVSRRCMCRLYPGGRRGRGRKGRAQRMPQMRIQLDQHRGYAGQMSQLQQLQMERQGREAVLPQMWPFMGSKEARHPRTLSGLQVHQMERPCSCAYRWPERIRSRRGSAVRGDILGDEDDRLPGPRRGQGMRYRCPDHSDRDTQAEGRDHTVRSV